MSCRHDFLNMTQAQFTGKKRLTKTGVEYLYMIPCLECSYSQNRWVELVGDDRPASETVTESEGFEMDDWTCDHKTVREHEVRYFAAEDAEVVSFRKESAYVVEIWKGECMHCGEELTWERIAD